MAGSYFKTKGDWGKKERKFLRNIKISYNVFLQFAVICFIVSILNLFIFSKDERFKDFINETVVRIEEYFEIPLAE